MGRKQPLNTDQWVAREAKRSRGRRSFSWGFALTPFTAAAAFVAGGLAGPAASLALGVAAALLFGAWRNDTALYGALGCASALFAFALIGMFIARSAPLFVLTVLAALLAMPFVIGLVLLGAAIARWEQRRKAPQPAP